MLERTESWVRRIGGGWMFVVFVAVYSGYLKGLSKEKGMITGNAPGATRALLRGSPALLTPVTLLSFWGLRLIWRPILPSVSRGPRWICLVIGSLLYFPGMALMLWGRITMGAMHNISNSTGAQLFADHRLITTGPFGVIRHPMYVGGMMAEIGALLLYRTWTTLLMAVNAPTLPLRARREEELLARRFGTEWEEYASRVPGWIPRSPR